MTCISTHASHRGAKGEHLFEGHFLEQGIFIAAPKHDLHRVDYVVEWEEQLVRVNVKTLHWNPKHKVFKAETRTSCPGGNRPYTPDEIDYFGVVSLEHNLIWMVPLSAVRGTSLSWHPPGKVYRKRVDSFNWDPYLINKGSTTVVDTNRVKLS